METKFKFMYCMCMYVSLVAAVVLIYKYSLDINRDLLMVYFNTLEDLQFTLKWQTYITLQIISFI